MEKQERHFFAGGNTAKGFTHFYASILEGLDPLYILTGGQVAGSSEVIRAVGEACLGRGLAVEWLHTPLNRERFDGVLIPELNAGVVDVSAPYSYEPIAPGVIEQYVHLDLVWDTEKLSRHKEEIVQLSRGIQSFRQRAYKTFAEALAIHDEWEHLFISNMNMEAASQVTREMMRTLLGAGSQAKVSRVRHQFLGAASCIGAVDYIQDLTKDLGKRYFIKGRPGSGKSTMLKKIAAEAEQRGFDVEVYHCGFDPGSLDMLIIPERSVAIFDSTAPHEYFPDKDTDEIVDMYTKTIAPGTDERYAADLAEIKSRYQAKMSEATHCLAEANRLEEKKQAVYQPAISSQKLEEIKQQIISELNQLN